MENKYLGPDSWALHDWMAGQRSSVADNYQRDWEWYEADRAGVVPEFCMPVARGAGRLGWEAAKRAYSLTPT
jgi:hypothetical protein